MYKTYSNGGMKITAWRTMRAVLEFNNIYTSMTPLDTHVCSLSQSIPRRVAAIDARNILSVMIFDWLFFFFSHQNNHYAAHESRVR